MKSLKKNGLLFLALLINTSCIATKNLLEVIEEHSVGKQQNETVKIVSPHPDLKIKFLGCVALNSTILMEFEVVRHGHDAKINFGSVANIAIDDAGKQYELEYSVSGGNWRSGYSSQADLFIAEVPTSIRYKINNVSEQVKVFKQLNLKLHSPQIEMSSEPIRIVDIPISREEKTLKFSVPSISVDEDFYTFEKKFVADADFQMSRIDFSNLGYKYDDDPESSGVKLTPENWSLFKSTFEDASKKVQGQYKTDMKLTSEKCIQRFWIENSSFLLEYTYTKIGGKWYLTKFFERY